MQVTAARTLALSSTVLTTSKSTSYIYGRRCYYAPNLGCEFVWYHYRFFY
jgi:hypothetical protein